MIGAMIELGNKIKVDQKVRLADHVNTLQGFSTGFKTIAEADMSILSKEIAIHEYVRRHTDEIKKLLDEYKPKEDKD